MRRMLCVLLALAGLLCLAAGRTDADAPAPSAGASVGGPVSPAGVPMHCPLPPERHKRNISVGGLGCCVFRSMGMAADWQNVPALLDFPEWMRGQGVQGGGYPSKVDDLVKRICASRGVPVPEYLQVRSRDLDLLRRACKAGRMVSVTYGRSPTGRYGGQHIDHMVNLPHADDQWFAVLDNNYLGGGSESVYEWMTPAEALKAFSDGDREGMYWAVILLGPPPSPRPKTKK